MTTYDVDGEVVDLSAAGADAALAAAHAAKRRPRCLCMEGGAEIYLARLPNGRIVAKRLPGTGGSHAPECPHYEPPAGLSGRGELEGHAVREDLETGATLVSLAFALSKGSGRAPPAGAAEETAGVVKAQRSRLNARGLLHLLWEDARLTYWVPRWASKRNWAVVRRHVLDAAGRLVVRKSSLQDRMFIPSIWSSERQTALRREREARLPPPAPSATAPRALVIVVGEVKQFEDGRRGKRLLIRHLPDWSIFLTEKLYASVERRFATELALWRADDRRHLVVLATLSIDMGGSGDVEELTLMACSAEWLPLESAADGRLLEELVRAERAFIKCLRYQLPPTERIASALLTDTAVPVPLFIAAPPAEHEDPEAQDNGEVSEAAAGIADRAPIEWIWDPACGEMPALPPKSQSRAHG